MNRPLHNIVCLLIFLLASNISYSQEVITSPEIDSLQMLIQSEQDDSMVVNYLSSISYNYRELNADSAIAYGAKTLALAEEISSQYRVARVKRFIADTYEQAGELSNARINYQEAIAIFENLDKKDEVSTTLLSLSIVLTKEFKTEQAISILHRLIDLSDETGDWDLE